MLQNNYSLPDLLTNSQLLLFIGVYPFNGLPLRDVCLFRRKATWKTTTKG